MVMEQINRRPLLTSISLHIIILLAMIVSYEFSSETPVVENSKSDVINAVMVDDVLMQPIKLPPEPVPTPTPDFKPEPTPEPIPKLEPKPEPKPEPKLIPKVEPKPVTKAIALEKPKKVKPKPNLMEEQLLADIEKQQKLDKKAKQKPKLKPVAKHSDLEREFAKELQNQSAKALQQQMANEAKKLAGVRSSQVQGVVDKYKALILQAISRRWLVPANIDKSLSTVLLIRVAPGGDVLDVMVIKSSGDVALDRSARDAVYKSSPLPVPADVDAFDQFRQFKLKVKPQNLFSGDILTT